jgi:hypothetical protein
MNKFYWALVLSLIISSSLGLAQSRVVVTTDNPLVTSSLKYQGAWSSTQSYNLNDSVLSGGILYFSTLSGNTNLPPATNLTYWTPFSSGTMPATTFSSLLGVISSAQITSSIISSSVQGATGCSTVGYVWVPKSNTCVSISSGSGIVNSGTAYSPAFYAAGGASVSGVTPFTGLGYWSTNAPPTAATSNQIQTAIGLDVYDVSGVGASAAAAALTAAEVFSANGSNISSGTIAAARIAALPYLSSSLTTPQTMAGALNVPVVNTVISVAGSPAVCTYSSVTYHTQASCAVQAALAVVASSSMSVEVDFPLGMVNIDSQITLPNATTGWGYPTLVLKGGGGTDTGYGTHLKLTTPQNHLLYKAPGANSPVHIEGIWFDGNNESSAETVLLANICCSAGINDVSVSGSLMTGFNSSQINITAGGSGGNSSYEYSIHDLKTLANNSATNTNSLASLAVVMNTGVPTISISNGGANYTNAKTSAIYPGCPVSASCLPIELVASPSVYGTTACTDPGWYLATISGGVATSITTISPASGCGSNTIAYLLDNPPAQFGAIFSSVSDSSVYDYISQAVGIPVYANGTVSNCSISSGVATLTLSSNVNLFAPGEYVLPRGLTACAALTTNGSIPVISASATKLVLSTSAADVSSQADSGTVVYADDGYGLAVGGGGGLTFFRPHIYYSESGIRVGGGTYYDYHNDSNFNYGAFIVQGNPQFFNMNTYYNFGVSSFTNAKGAILNSGANFVTTTCTSSSPTNYIEFVSRANLPINGRADLLGTGFGVLNDQPCGSALPITTIGNSSAQNTLWGYGTWNGVAGALLGSTTKQASSGTNYAAPPLVWHNSVNNHAFEDLELLPIVGSGTNPSVTYMWNRMTVGTTGNVGFQIGDTTNSINWNQYGNFTGVGSLFETGSLGTNGNIYSNAASQATSTTNYQASCLQWNNNYWNGTSSALDQWSLCPSVSVGTNGQSQLILHHNGSPNPSGAKINQLIIGDVNNQNSFQTLVISPLISADLGTAVSGTNYGSNPSCWRGNFFNTSGTTSYSEACLSLVLGTGTSPTQTITLSNPSNSNGGVYLDFSAATTTKVAGLSINSSTPITSTSSTNSQMITCPTGGTGTQYCDAAGAWVTPTGAGIVNAISIASANGISGTSSGGTTPSLTLSLGAISPTSVTTTGAANGNLNLAATGSAPSAPLANNIQITVPNSVTAYALQLPPAQPSVPSSINCTAAGSSVCTFVPVGTFSHIIGNGGTPNAVTDAGAGGTGVSVTATAATDLSGYINLTAGASPLPNSGLVSLVFATPYPVAPKCWLWPSNGAAAALVGAAAPYIQQASTTTNLFVIFSNSTALTAGGVYQWGYGCIQ